MTFRHFAACAALVFATASVSAQPLFLPQFGVMGGANFGSLSDAGSAELSSATGFHVGAFAELGLGIIGVRPAVLFVRAGDIEFPGTERGDFSTSYLAVPFDVRYSPLPTPVVKPYFLAGPEIRLPLGDLSELPNARSIDLALNVGVGAKVGTIVGPTFFGELRYAFDLSGFTEEGEVDGLQSDGTFRLNGVFVSVGVGL